MRLLGIDYGTKKVGVAITDESGRFARPLAVITNDQTLMTKLLKMIADSEAKKIIIGRSLNYARTNNPIMVEVEKLVAKLEAATKLPVELENEDLTTQEAKQIIGADELTDARAAALILKSYVDRTMA